LDGGERRSVHGAGASPLPAFALGAVHLGAGQALPPRLAWPESGQLVVPGLRTEPRELYLLADPKKSPLAWRREGDRDLVVDLRAASLPGTALWEADTVLCLEYQGELAVDRAVLLLERDYPSIFESWRGETSGPGLTYQFDKGVGRHDYMTQGWKSLEDRIRWPARFPRGAQLRGGDRVRRAKECTGTSTESRSATPRSRPRCRSPVGGGSTAPFRIGMVVRHSLERP